MNATNRAPRNDVKHRGKSEQERRREEVLKRQKEKRRESTENARKIVEMGENLNSFPLENQILSDLESSPSISSFPSISPDPIKEENMVMESKAEREEKRLKEIERKKEEFYKKQLMIPELLTDIPEDLEGGWMGMRVEREKKRCIVIANNGETIARDANSGSILQRCQSCLPNGSTKTRGGPDNYTILDCVFDGKEFRVMDLMSWGGHLYYDCSSDFRFWWIQSKLAESEATKVSSHNAFPFLPMHWFECDAESIKNNCGDFERLEGLLFYNKETHYTTGITPLLCFLPSSQIPSFMEQLLGQMNQ